MSLARARGFTLDEYVGLPDGHPCQYRTVIDAGLRVARRLRTRRRAGARRQRPRPRRRVRAYEAAMQQAGGIDLQILGIGTDGHIAFNEPGSSLASRTRIKTLTEQTRRDNARFFGGDIDAVPRHCLTQGLGTIMQAPAHRARRDRAAARPRRSITSSRAPSPRCGPRTILQHHPHVTVLVDDAAASRLQLADYYRYTYAHRHLAR